MHDFSTRRGEKLIRCICECVFNTVEGNISLPSDDPKKSVKYKTPLQRIAAKLEGKKAIGAAKRIFILYYQSYH